MISINFFYKYSWVGYVSGQRDDFKITPELEESLEEIRKQNWPEEITQNISFDIYWYNNEYTGIHNYRINGNHMQNRYEGYLKIDTAFLEQLAMASDTDASADLRVDSSTREIQKS